MPKLLIHEGGQASVFELLDDEVSIGRGASNAVQVADGHASKHHAVVRRVAGRPKLVDLESKNGTRVNGEFRNQRWLQHGDVISIGAASMTYDAGEVAGRPAGSRASPAKPAAVQAAAAVAYAPARAPGVVRPSRRSEREVGEDGEEEPKRPARRSGNSLAVGVLMGAGAIGIVAILFLLLSRSGATRNSMAIAEAKRIAARGVDHYAEAIAYLRDHADPSEPDGYGELEKEMKEYEKTLANQGATKRAEEAAATFKGIYNDYVEQWKNKYSDESLALRLRKLVRDYPDSMKVMELLNSGVEPYPKMRALMERASPK